MSLPKVAIPTDVVDVDGTDVGVRGLTRGENAAVSRLIDAKDLEAAEVYILARGTDTDEAEVREWYANTTSGLVNKVLEGIQVLTGLSEEAGKSGP